MNKKDIVDDKEDLEIKKVAESSNGNKLLLIVLIAIFCVTLFITVQYVVRYYKATEANKDAVTIDIKNNKTSASIINNGLVKQKITSESFEDTNEIKVENICVIELIPNKDATKDSGIKFDVKYNITKNDFEESNVATNNSEVLVMFSYSFDKQNWTYINNVISTSTSNISPLIGNTYDIAGLITNLSVATDYELKIGDSRREVIYWRSETIFKNRENNDVDKEFSANLELKYKESL